LSNFFSKHFASFKQWGKGGARAPHKPLMLLLALGRYQNGIKEFYYSEIEDELIRLLVEYGPARAVYKPEEPFWRLGNIDGTFVLSNHAGIRIHKDGGVGKSQLRALRVTCQFNQEIQKKFNNDPKSIIDVALELIAIHFEPSYVEDLLDSVGITLDTLPLSLSRKRDPNFRKKIINAYENRCAVCGFHLIMNQYPIGIEAAHIKWHNAGGPDTEDNGIALCTMHHKMFDFGIFLIEPQTFIVKVSEGVSCFNSANDYVLAFHNSKIHQPIRKSYYPRDEFLHWHRNEIFKGMVRG
jgi:putative restriction endonuclease